MWFAHPSCWLRLWSRRWDQTRPCVCVCVCVCVSLGLEFKASLQVRVQVHREGPWLTRTWGLVLPRGRGVPSQVPTATAGV